MFYKTVNYIKAKYLLGYESAKSNALDYVYIRRKLSSNCLFKEGEPSTPKV